VRVQQAAVADQGVAVVGDALVVVRQVLEGPAGLAFLLGPVGLGEQQRGGAAELVGVQEIQAGGGQGPGSDQDCQELDVEGSAHEGGPHNRPAVVARSWSGEEGVPRFRQQRP
jgi:hypothetical protein